MSLFNLFKKGKNNTEFKFNEPENTTVFTCKHITENNNPILLVTHDDDGYWQFLCGQEEHSEADAKVISLKEAVQIDNSLNDLFEMPKGYGAERTTQDENWKPFKL